MNKEEVRQLICSAFSVPETICSASAFPRIDEVTRDNIGLFDGEVMREFLPGILLDLLDDPAESLDNYFFETLRQLCGPSIRPEDQEKKWQEMYSGYTTEQHSAVYAWLKYMKAHVAGLESDADPALAMWQD